MDEGSAAVMTEYVLEEKRLRAKLGVLEQQLVEPEARLDKAKAILLKAKAAYEQALEVVKPLRSDKTLLEGELQLLEEKKQKLRMEMRMQEAGQIRPGTSEFVEQMSQLVGSPEELALRKATKDAEADEALARLKGKMNGGKDGAQ